MSKPDVLRRKCGHCRRWWEVQFGTDGRGNVIEVNECPCTERRLRGLCMDCPAPVEGQVGRALRCARCKKVAAAAAYRRYRKKHPEKVAALQRRRYADPEKRAAIQAREREYRSQPEVAARIKAQRARRAVLNPGQKAEYNRRYKEKYPERVRAQQNAANKKRRKSHREWAHLYQTKYVGEDCPDVECRTCGGVVPYDGRGRPHVECPWCAPESWTPEALIRNIVGQLDRTVGLRIPRVGFLVEPALGGVRVIRVDRADAWRDR